MAEEESLDTDISIKVDGKPLGLAPFVRKILSLTIMGMVAALKGGEDAKEIEISLKRRS